MTRAGLLARQMRMHSFTGSQIGSATTSAKGASGGDRWPPTALPQAATPYAQATSHPGLLCRGRPRATKARVGRASARVVRHRGKYRVPTTRKVAALAALAAPTSPRGAGGTLVPGQAGGTGEFKYYNNSSPTKLKADGVYCQVMHQNFLALRHT